MFKNSFLRIENVTVLIHSHGKNKKWHINYLSWQTNENRERYNLITTLIFWQFLDALQVILSNLKQRDYFRANYANPNTLSIWSGLIWKAHGTDRSWRQTKFCWQPVICFLNEIIFHASMHILPLLPIYRPLKLPCCLCLALSAFVFILMLKQMFKFWSGFHGFILITCSYWHSLHQSIVAYAT